VSAATSKAIGGAREAARALLPVSRAFPSYSPFGAGDLEGECDVTNDGRHRASFRAGDAGLDPPDVALHVRDELRERFGKTAVGAVMVHVAECQSCGVRDSRYGVIVRVSLGDGLVLEREYGVPEEPE
jgi:hypothetical protein